MNPTEYVPPFAPPASAAPRRFGLVSGVFRSLFSADLYRDVAISWPGINALYLFFVLALVWLPDAYKVHRGAAHSTELEDEILRQIPTITLSQGEMTLDPPGPHHIKDPETGKLILVLDTEATVESLDQFDGDLMIVNRSQLITRNAQRGQVRVQELSQFPDFTLDQARLQWIVAWMKRWLGVTFYLGSLPISFVYRLLQAFLYGGVAVVLSRLLGGRLDYGPAIRLSTIAVTPSLLLGAVLGLIDATPRALVWWPACMILTVGYLVFGVHASLKATGDS